MSQKPTVMEKLISKYALYIILGLVISISGLALGIVRTANAPMIFTLQVAGDTKSAALLSALTTERVLQHIIEQWIFVGMAFLWLGIGSAISTIVMNLKATGANVQKAVSDLGQGVAGLKLPLFARIFPKLLFIGWIEILFIFFGLTIPWAINVANVVSLQVAGQQGTAAYQQALFIDSVLDPIIKPGKFTGTALMMLGIALGLTTIVMNLRMQGNMLPQILGKLLPSFSGASVDVKPMGGLALVPKKLVVLVVTGSIITITGLLPLGLIKAYNVATFLGQRFVGDTTSAVYQSAVITNEILEVNIEPWKFVGMSLVLLGIGFWLLTIIKALRGQREMFGNVISSITGATAQPIEKPLWTMRIVPPLLIAGFIVVFLMWIPFSLPFRNQAALTLVTEELLDRTGSEAFKSALLNERLLEAFIKPTKFIGLSLQLLGIGFSLVTIVINLRLTAMRLPGMFAKLLSTIQHGSAPGSQGEESAMKTNPLSLAPWKLYLPIALGAAIAISATLPLAIIREQAILSGNSLLDQMLEHFILPWKIGLGMALIFFSIGRFFATIVGFVKARRQIITEGVESLVTFAKQKPAS